MRGRFNGRVVGQEYTGRNTRHNGRAGMYNAVQSAFAPSLDITLANGLGPLFTYTRATTATVTDFEGLIKSCLSGELRVQGARRVRNLRTSSQNSTGLTADKSGLGVNAAFTNNYAEAPDGTMTAMRLVLDCGSTGAGDSSQCYQSLGAAGVNSCWLKSNTGSSFVINGEYTNQTPLTVTTTWQRFSWVGVTSYFGFSNYGNIAGGVQVADVLVWGQQKEDTTGQSNQNPSEYVSVGVLSAPYHGYFVDGVKYFAYENGNTVASGVVTEAQGAAITGTIGYLEEGARTNLQKQNRTLTTAPWTNAGTPAATQNATGIDGATTAWTLTDNDALATEYIYCAAAELALSGSTQYTYSIFVGKQGSAPSGYPCISVDNGTYLAGCTIDPYNGTATVWTAYTGFTVLTSSATCSSWNSNFWRVELTFTTHSSMTTGTVVIIPAGRTSANSATGTNDVAATGVTVFDAPQIEAGAFASSPIITTTAAVARNADQLTCPSAGILNFAQGAAFVKATGGGNASGRYIDLFSTYPLARSGAGGVNLTFNDGTNNETVGTLSSGAFSTPSKMMTAWGGGASAGCVDGGSVTTGLFDGALAGATLYIGGAATVETYAVIEQVKLYLTKPSAAQMQAMTS